MPPRTPQGPYFAVTLAYRVNPCDAVARFVHDVLVTLGKNDDVVFTWVTERNLGHAFELHVQLTDRGKKSTARDVGASAVRALVEEAFAMHGRRRVGTPLLQWIHAERCFGL